MPAETTEPSTQPGRLQLLTTTCLVVASMVGIGVFSTSGYALADLGSRRWVMAAWIVGSVIALCGAISYSALVRDLCESGGEYLFLSRRVHPLAGFLAGWISLVAGFTGAIAAAATGLAEFVVPLFAGGDPAQLAFLTKAVAASVITACACQHCVSRQFGARLQTGLVIVKLLLLVGLFAFAATHFGVRPPLEVGPTDMPSLGRFAMTLMWVALSFSGFNAAVYVASEVDNPQQTVPRAMVLGTSLVVVLYLVLNLLFIYSGPIEALAGAGDIAAISVDLLAGPTAANVCRGLISVALLTSVSANLMAGPRVYDRMAADGLFPIRVMQQGQVPRSAILLQAGLAIFIVAWSDLESQLGFLGVLLTLSTAATVASLFFPRAEQRERPKPFVLLAAAVYTAASFVFAGMALQFNRENLGGVWIAVAVTLVAGVLFYVAMLLWQRQRR